MADLVVQSGGGGEVGRVVPVDHPGEAIIERNIKTQLAVARGASPKKLNPKASEKDLLEPGITPKAGRRSIAELPAEMRFRHILPSQFTESDKRNVIWKFLSSQEVLFLIYGLMFPTQTIAAAN